MKIIIKKSIQETILEELAKIERDNKIADYILLSENEAIELYNTINRAYGHFDLVFSNKEKIAKINTSTYYGIPCKVETLL